MLKSIAPLNCSDEIVEALAQVRDFPGLRKLDFSLQAYGQLDLPVVTAIRMRRDELGSERFTKATGIKSGESELDWRIIRDTSRVVGVFGMRCKYPARTFQMIREHGLKETVIRCVNKKQPTKGYHCLTAWGEGVLRYEHIVLDFESEFSEGQTLSKARLRLDR